MAEESDVTDYDNTAEDGLDEKDDLIPEGKDPKIFDDRHGLYNAPNYGEDGTDQFEEE